MIDILCAAAGRHPNVEMTIRADGLRLTAFGDDAHSGAMVSRMITAIQMDNSHSPGLLIDETVAKMADELREFSAMEQTI